MIDPDVILEKAELLLNPYHIFLYLKSANISSLDLHRACEASIYYFDNKVEWADFLVSLPIKHQVKLVEKGILSARFLSGNDGTRFYFICNKAYEKRVLHLIEEMSGLGYEVKRCSSTVNNRWQFVLDET